MPEKNKPTPPELTTAQRMAALEKAGIVRKKRAELKKRLQSGEVNLADVLRMSESEKDIAGIKLVTVLESIRGVGKVKARRKMGEMKISEVKRVSGLTTRQKDALLNMFGP